MNELNQEEEEEEEKIHLMDGLQKRVTVCMCCYSIVEESAAGQTRDHFIPIKATSNRNVS